MEEERKEITEEELSQVDGGHSFTPIHLEKERPDFIKKAMHHLEDALDALEDLEPAKNKDRVVLGKINPEDQKDTGKKSDYKDSFHSSLV